MIIDHEQNIMIIYHEIEYNDYWSLNNLLFFSIPKHPTMKWSILKWVKYSRLVWNYNLFHLKLLL